MSSDSDLVDYFPNLALTDYEVTSPKTYDYNCFAWAAEEDDRWWSPISSDDYYWPEDAPTDLSLEGVMQTYGLLGFEACESANLETGFQKIAIFADAQGAPTHAARQLPDGQWTSKLGDWEDIAHELAGLEGEKYGTVQQILKRPL